MKSSHCIALFAASALALAAPARAQLTTLSSFNPSNNADPCGTAIDPVTGNLWVYDCFGGAFVQYTSAGVFVSQIVRPGETANDCDLEFSPESMLLGATSIPEGTLLFINGETGVADIYAVDKASGAVLATLATSFGVGHVIGGGYHRARDSFFLMQDKVPGGADANRIAEVDPVTGAVLNTFLVSAPSFTINYGDLDVSLTGNLFLVSSDELAIAEMTPAGVYVQQLTLPAGVTSLSGIALYGSSGETWVGGTGGLLWQLGGLPACDVVSYCTAGTSTNGCLASISGSGTASATAGSGFNLDVVNVEGAKSGLIFYSVTGPLASPWGASSSYLCAAAPTQRTATQVSGGTAGACDGAFGIDWNQYIATNPGSVGVPFAGGETVFAQAWFRDPPSPKTTTLSDALQFDVCP